MTRTVPFTDGKITLAELRAAYPALAVAVEGGLNKTIDPDEASLLDGPMFARWLRSHGLRPDGKLGKPIAKKVRRWADGDFVNLGAADEVLILLGRNLSELPDTIWRDRPVGIGRTVSRYMRETILAEKDAGTPVEELADRYGVAVSTIRTWATPAHRRRAAKNRAA